MATGVKVFVVLASLVQHVAAQPSFNSVTVVPSSPTVGVPITSVTWSITSTNNIAFNTIGGTTLYINALGDPLFTGGMQAPTVNIFTLNGVDKTSAAPAYLIEQVTATQLQVYLGDVDLLAGETLVLEIVSDLLAPVTAGAQTFTINDGTTTSGALPGWGASGAGAASDPITWFQDKRTKFWLPAEKYTPLLETPDVSILAKPLFGPKDMQWFGRLQITLPGGKLLAEVATTQGEAADRVKMIGDQIKVEAGEDIQVGHYKEATLLSTSDGSVKAAMFTWPYHIARTHGKNEMEYLHIETPSVAFSIYSSHAGNEFPEDIAMQTKYKHLDFIIESTHFPWQNYTGVLPELWEVIPRSAAVEAMTISPLDKAKVCEA